MRTFARNADGRRLRPAAVGREVNTGQKPAQVPGFGWAMAGGAPTGTSKYVAYRTTPVLPS